MKKIEEKINLISEEIKKVEKEAVKESLIVEMKNAPEGAFLLGYWRKR